MPGFDQTGPEGRGPTGRRLGPCSEEEDRRLFFFRRGRRGGGRGFRWFSQQSYNVKDELEAEKTYLENRLNAVNKLINQPKED
jgi:hypothetical protein